MAVARIGLVDRLRRRSDEIEEAVMARVTSLGRLPARAGPEYAQGLRAAVGAAVEYSIDGMVRGAEEGAPVPGPLISQAREAARSGVGLDTVLRRCIAGHAVLGDFLIQEAEAEVAAPELKRLLRRLASSIDCLLAAVTAAYGLEERRLHRSSEHRRGELVERLLAGEPLDPTELGYRLESSHLGLITQGGEARQALSTLARRLGARALIVTRDDDRIWAWLGTQELLDPIEVREEAVTLTRQTTIVLGEPAEGVAGWRLTHRQARAALPLARGSNSPFVRYVDVALLATVIQDELLVTSLRRLYLQPLEGGRDGGAALRNTLRAYFSAEQNLSSAAGLLGIDRRTVSNRLHAAEALIGRSLDENSTDLRIALSLDELDLTP